VPLIWQNKKVTATLLEVAADPKHPGAETGCLSILPTWNMCCSIWLATPIEWRKSPGFTFAPSVESVRRDTSDKNLALHSQVGRMGGLSGNWPLLRLPACYQPVQRSIALWLG
jgi:hypothetical protein